MTFNLATQCWIVGVDWSDSWMGDVDLVIESSWVIISFIARVVVGSRRWLQVVQIVLCTMEVLVTGKLSSLFSLFSC